MSWLLAGAVVVALFVLVFVVLGLLIRVVARIADKTLNSR